MENNKYSEMTSRRMNISLQFRLLWTEDRESELTISQQI